MVMSRSQMKQQVSKGPQKAKKLGGYRPGYGTTAKGSLS